MWFFVEVEVPFSCSKQSVYFKTVAKILYFDTCYFEMDVRDGAEAGAGVWKRALMSLLNQGTRGRTTMVSTGAWMSSKEQRVAW